jgi:cation diffusion facilitator CzcD-associated flavoprotein CzcO
MQSSSGQQIVEAIQPAVGHLTVFIRQPSWILGPFGEPPRQYSDKEIDDFVNKPGLLLQKRKKFENVVNSYFSICKSDGTAQAQIRAFLTGEMMKKLPDPMLQDLLIPRYGVGCRRPTSGNNYLECLTSDNANVVVGEIKEVTAEGVVDGNGVLHRLDALICATGFDTSYKPRFSLVGASGKSLQEAWAKNAKAYMATAVADFPNYFMFCGPNNPFASGAYLSSVGNSLHPIFDLLMLSSIQSAKQTTCSGFVIVGRLSTFTHLLQRRKPLMIS